MLNLMTPRTSVNGADPFIETVNRSTDGLDGELMSSEGYLATAVVLFFIGFFGFFLNLVVIVLMLKDKELLAMIFLTSMALRLIWLPLSLWVIRTNQTLVNTLCQIPAMKTPPLNSIISFLNCPNIQMLAIAGYILWTVVNSTGAYTRMKAWIDQMCSKLEEAPAPCADPVPVVRESSPEEEEEEVVPPRPCMKRYC